MKDPARDVDAGQTHSAEDKVYDPTTKPTTSKHGIISICVSVVQKLLGFGKR